MEQVQGLGFLLLVVLCVLNHFFTVSGNSEVDALITLKRALTDPNGVLTSWNSSLVNPCVWAYVMCNVDDFVTGVNLGNANLSGELVPRLGSLRKLQHLELSNNSLSGKIPPDLGNLENLVNLDLSQNQLSGPIPNTLGKLSKLRFLLLNNNTLSGAIPYSLTAVSLQVLDVSSNNLSGFIPVNGSFSLFTPISFQNNPHLKYPTLPLPPPTPYPPSSSGPSPNPPSSSGGEEPNGAITVAKGVAVGATLSFFIFCSLFWSDAISLSRWRRMRFPDPFVDVPAEEEPTVLHLAQLERFSLRELLVATDDLSHKNVLGRGGFGKVYRGRLADGSLVAVKRLKEECTQGGELQYQTEVEMISRAVHRNLLRLKGFCMTPTERILVYPYMTNGSVASCLRERKESQTPLDWPKRKQIALDSARGLTYLHEHCNPKIIHRDVKAANILLDDEFEAVLGDFGLATLMDCEDTHVTMAVCGTTGHIAPEYLATGKSSIKTDVFAYGVMLLELITGQGAFDLVRLANNEEVMLLSWVKGLLLKEKKLEAFVDVELQGKYTEKEVEELLQVALLCTQSSPGERLEMSEVVRMLEGEGLGERWEMLQKEEVFRHEFNHSLLPNFRGFEYFVHSKFNPNPDELSGPR